jgi:putative spermidine/putrescine transport system permease protein
VYQLGFSNFDFPFAAVLSMTALALTVAILMALSRLMRGLERYGIQH